MDHGVAPADHPLRVEFFAGRPTWGSWLLCSLGSERKELPAYVVLDPARLPVDGSNWSSGFLPAVYQGTPFRAGTPVAAWSHQPMSRPRPDGINSTC